MKRSNEPNDEGRFTQAFGKYGEGIEVPGGLVERAMQASPTRRRPMALRFALAGTMLVILVAAALLLAPKPVSAATLVKKMQRAITDARTLRATTHFFLQNGQFATATSGALYRDGAWLYQRKWGGTLDQTILTIDGKTWIAYPTQGFFKLRPSDDDSGEVDTGSTTALELVKKWAGAKQGDGWTQTVESSPDIDGTRCYKIVGEYAEVGLRTVIWVDSKTNLPFRSEDTFNYPETDKVSGGPRSVKVRTDFEFNAKVEAWELDPARFKDLRFVDQKIARQAVLEGCNKAIFELSHDRESVSVYRVDELSNGLVLVLYSSCRPTVEYPMPVKGDDTNLVDCFLPNTLKSTDGREYVRMQDLRPYPPKAFEREDGRPLSVVAFAPLQPKAFDGKKRSFELGFGVRTWHTSTAFWGKSDSRSVVVEATPHKELCPDFMVGLGFDHDFPSYHRLASLARAKYCRDIKKDLEGALRWFLDAHEAYGQMRSFRTYSDLRDVITTLEALGRLQEAEKYRRLMEEEKLLDPNERKAE